MNTEKDIVEQNEPDRGNPLTAELESDDQNHYREACVLALDFFKDSARIIKDYRGQREFALDCWLLAMGWHELSGVETQEELALRYKKSNGDPMTKANVSKMVKKFQSVGFLNLPPAIGQRKLISCKNMSDKRKQQLPKKS
jgi:hypothetical protein